MAPNSLKLTVSTAQQGLAICARCLPDCILLDYHLPGFNGLEFLDYFTNQYGKATSVILLTGQGDETVALEAMKEGVHDYLVKSQIDAARLAGVIKDGNKKLLYAKQLRHRTQTLEELAHLDH